MKQALEALETPRPLDNYPPILEAYVKTINNAITFLRQAIAEAEQEQGQPVAEVTSETGAEITMSWWHEPALPIGTKLYTTPQQRKPLTDDEIAEVAERMEASDPTDSFWRDFARSVEAAHGIKGEA